jgi:serine/threonine protein kinase/Tol biopolymer transport system component
VALTPGTRLGVYEVAAWIGEGGMGQVYRARDTKLNRDVALKVLPDSVASDPDRLARFTREAQTLASLNHPNIAHIHGLEESDGVRALVMELVEGEDLSQRIARGAIPIDDALPLAKQIADALEAAHEQGIIHRDLKPANIKVRSDGTVKVLDFGLAKAMEPSGAISASASMSPTITTPAMTQGGLILGTAAYMSPEQAKGRPVDKRSDVWAFGCVLYEMLTGARAFQGDDVSDTLAAVLRGEPNWMALPAGTPPPIRRLLRRCLEKDRRRRLDSAADARLEIEEALNTPSAADAATASLGMKPHSAWPRALTWTLAASTLGLAIALVLLWARWRAEKPGDRPLARLDVDLGADVSLPTPNAEGSNVAISPDGTRLAYASGSPTKLFTRRLDQPKSTDLPGTDGAVGPFFSPDGQWVGFYARGKLNKISVDGGAVVPLGDVTAFTGASWGEDGNILVGDRDVLKGLVRIPAGGGPPETVAPLGTGESALARPQILPGGKAVLFTTSTSTSGDADRFNIEVLTLVDHHRKIVARGGTTARYLATSNGAGHLVYTNKTTLFAIPFDLDKLETRGTAVPVLDDVAYNTRIGAGGLDFSRTGTLVYRRTSASMAAMTTVQWVDATGNKEPLRAKPGIYESPSLSPDGKRLALVLTDEGRPDVWVFDQQRETRLTFGGAAHYAPIWSPDGQYVVFGRTASTANGLLWTRADGASEPQVLTQAKRTNQTPWSFTQDGKWLAYFETRGGGQIWTVPVEEQGGQLKAGKPEPFLKSSSADQLPSFSPDGRWLAYESDAVGRNEVYVRAFRPPSPGQGGPWQISNGGGTWPRWSPTEHELMYQSGDQIMAASYTVKGDRFVPDKPRVWIAKLGGTQWDLAPNGKRVAVLTPVETVEAPKQEHEVIFLLNFFDELKRRVPVGQ